MSGHSICLITHVYIHLDVMQSVQQMDTFFVRCQ